MWKLGVFTLACAATVFGWTVDSQAAAVIVTTPITVFAGNGTGDVPLAYDATNVLNNGGYAFVPSNATISESATGDSVGVTTISFDLNPLTSSVDVHVSSLFRLYFDVSLMDSDTGTAPNYVPGIPATLTPKAPLEISIEGTVNAFEILTALLALPPGATEQEQYDTIIAAATGAVSITPTITPARYALGVDVNMNGIADVMTLSTSDLDPTSLELDFADGDLENLLTAIGNLGLANPLEIQASVSITGLNLTLTGEVFDDANDPPFTLAFGDVTLASELAVADVPEPSSLLLLAAAGLGLLLGARLRRLA